jgi:hypothetical protein
MAIPQLSASPSQTPEIPALHALPPPRRAPLAELTPELSELICDCIRLDGVSDAAAGALAGVPSATLARWKAESQRFALALEIARAQFEAELMRAIKNARKANGERDWRAQAWLLQHTSSEGVVAPARKAKASPKPDTAAAQKCANRPETPAAPPAGSARAHAPIVPESAAKPRPSVPPAAPLPEKPAPAAQNTTILPETPKSHLAVA